MCLHQRCRLALKTKDSAKAHVAGNVCTKQKGRQTRVRELVIPTDDPQFRDHWIQWQRDEQFVGVSHLAPAGPGGRNGNEVDSESDEEDDSEDDSNCQGNRPNTACAVVDSIGEVLDGLK